MTLLILDSQILIVAWPYGDTMLGSIRKVPAGNRPHAAPPEFTTDVSLKTIPKGTFVTPSGDWQYTFLCSGCLDRKDVYPGTAGKESFAWALSKDPLREPANRTGRLNHHHAGSGRFTAYMTAARHVAFPQWAKLAA
jgi:Cytochrome domain of cellobiose dehydrogenase